MSVRLILLAVAVLFLFSLHTDIVVDAYNYDHVNVTARANITNAAPEILEVLVDQDITLNAGGSKIVFCNATVLDWNGWDDVVVANATFYHSTSFSGDVDNNNSHFTNSSCSIDQDDLLDPYTAFVSCSFDVIHYANNGSWSCNVTVEDSFEYVDFLDNSTTINELFALNVTSIIDYGDLAVLDYSSDVSATITNFGNVDINVSVLGYGVTEGDGWGLVCEEGSNISVENQRFSLSSSSDWELMTPLSGTYQDVGLTLVQPTDLSNPVTSLIYWRLFVPPNPFGECLGTIRFTATTP